MFSTLLRYASALLARMARSCSSFANSVIFKRDTSTAFRPLLAIAFNNSAVDAFRWWVSDLALACLR